MPSYSEERKQQILNKLLPPSNMTVAEVSRIEGIGLQTLYNWRDKAKQQGRPVPGSKPTSEHWSAEAKFATVLETTSLNEAELSEYCRAKGLYVEQVKAWKADALRGFMSSREQELEAKRQRQADHKEIKQLKGELRRKEKALA
ncbi:transposase, partial [Rheinheimera sp.]|uniref:transposase n=1 Tax=Rheinheimera sp. TaxID=1869214 RepID=UPI0040473AC6